ncbi:hypothetical protein IV203_019029 [Nitzschia inconspicua]|uniref:Uncharacterized protein n=1 Tax=Nitzschia inconspicua TaxID=303405 RepID=A0A9K3PH01_9STRA|nr:hypothetical protein IV203_022647 [Nitzschia inconspicua]KAG7370459.1 hypothetical protein IV203_019029 [Nitzschia inconspicua]
MNSFFQSHQMAKTLNNSAALLIETGQYDRGISCLMEALVLSDRQHSSKYHPTTNNPADIRKWSSLACQCQHCSLEECILFSERIPLSSTEGPFSDDGCGDGDAEVNGYIHRRPISITTQSMQENHYMGATLSLIVTFNLALAHHLSAMDTFGWTTTNYSDVNNNNDHAHRGLTNCSTYKDTFQKILHLYELAYRWQIELEEDALQKQLQWQQGQKQQLQRTFHNNNNNNNNNIELDASSVVSIRFNMIISNNLSQIHRLVHNHSKHRQCLEHLLATIMFVVAADSVTQQWSTSRISITSSTSSSTTLRHQSSQQQQQQMLLPRHPRMDLEGFLCNAAPLIFRGHPCAGAA